MFDPPCAPRAQLILFSAFNNRYAGGSCHIVGRGKTNFVYELLGDVEEPIFFINDAICLEKYATKAETFFFAHDAQLLAWLDGSIHSTAVLPLTGKMFPLGSSTVLQHAGPLVFYRWRRTNKETLLNMTRDQIMETQELYNHSGTVHSLLHFAWYCGFTRIALIGCDGTAPADQQTGRETYDLRLANRSGSIPAPWNYAKIRKAQDLLATLFGFEMIYVGAPE
jgi:hypothetical protein